MSVIGVSPFRYISVQELMDFYMCSENTAKHRKNEISKKYCKKNISYYDLAKYEGYPVKDILCFFYG
jgi:hypothetical protein